MDPTSSTNIFSSLRSESLINPSEIQQNQLSSFQSSIVKGSIQNALTCITNRLTVFTLSYERISVDEKEENYVEKTIELLKKIKKEAEEAFRELVGNLQVLEADLGTLRNCEFDITLNDKSLENSMQEAFKQKIDLVKTFFTSFRYYFIFFKMKLEKAINKASSSEKLSIKTQNELLEEIESLFLSVKISVSPLVSSIDPIIKKI